MSARGHPGGSPTRSPAIESPPRAADGDSQYLRYGDDIVIVGPDGDRPCSIRVEPLSAGYNHGSFIFLGPGFTPGSPCGGSGGTPADPAAPSDPASP